MTNNMYSSVGRDRRVEQTVSGAGFNCSVPPAPSRLDVESRLWDEYFACDGPARRLDILASISKIRKEFSRDKESEG